MSVTSAGCNATNAASSSPCLSTCSSGSPRSMRLATHTVRQSTTTASAPTLASRTRAMLSDRPTPRAFPTSRPVALAGFVPDHSDGVAADSHRLPWGPRRHPGANNAGTVSDDRPAPQPPGRQNQAARRDYVFAVFSLYPLASDGGAPAPRRPAACTPFSAYETARPAPASDWMPYGGIGYRSPFLSSAARPSITLGRKRGGMAMSSSSSATPP